MQKRHEEHRTAEWILSLKKMPLSVQVNKKSSILAKRDGKQRKNNQQIADDTRKVLSRRLKNSLANLATMV